MSSFKKTYILPFKFEIPNYTQEFLQQRSIIKSWIKFIKRYLFIFIKQQNSLEIFNFSSEHQNILWINISAPSLGDSLMDLSSRVLLNDRKVDLFTDIKNAKLYQDDAIFSAIFTNKKEVDKYKYDLVIIDSYSTRSINIKVQIAPVTPFVGMFGYYNGPEVNRVLFSFHQMNNLLGYRKSEIEINKISKTSISISTKDQKFVNNIKLPSSYIAIALGGEWSYRTYNNWAKVIEELIRKDNNINIVLIGSENAKDYEKTILGKFSHANVISCVAQFTFNQTTQIIKKAQILLCCDGGLMHSASAVNTRIVPLFARLSEEMQLTENNRSFSLFDKTNVNNILFKDILQKYDEATNFDHNHLLIE